MDTSKLETYREQIREIIKYEKDEIDKRFKEAWAVAREAAGILYGSFGATDVWVFGSLTDKERFNQWSDIDIGVQGIAGEVYYRAAAKIISLSPDFDIDLVDVVDCRPTLKEEIKKGGIRI